MKVLKFKNIGKKVVANASDVYRDSDVKESVKAWASDGDLLSGSQAITLLQSETDGKAVVAVVSYITEPIELSKMGLRSALCDIDEILQVLKDEADDSSDVYYKSVLHSSAEYNLKAKKMLEGLLADMN